MRLTALHDHRLAAGSYALTAVATDGSGLTSTSAPVNITVSTGSGQPYGLTNRHRSGVFQYADDLLGSIPPLLSQTGVFSNTPNMIPANGLIPYQPNTPLWSDGAQKIRYMAVPNNGGPSPRPTDRLCADRHMDFPGRHRFCQNL